jgi:hypothetical protein
MLINTIYAIFNFYTLLLYNYYYVDINKDLF